MKEGILRVSRLASELQSGDEGGEGAEPLHQGLEPVCV